MLCAAGSNETATQHHAKKNYQGDHKLQKKKTRSNRGTRRRHLKEAGTQDEEKDEESNTTEDEDILSSPLCVEEAEEDNNLDDEQEKGFDVLKKTRKIGWTDSEGQRGGKLYNSGNRHP